MGRRFESYSGSLFSYTSELALRPHGQAVKTSPFHGGNRGPNPLGVIFKKYADVAQLAEQLICNQQVIGSSPIIGFLDGFPSGQRGQTVNLLATLSVVRIHLHPFEREKSFFLGIDML